MKLEAGKRYILRNGMITGPLECDNHEFYPFFCSEICEEWIGNGSYVYNGDPCEYDIVSEYIEAPRQMNLPTP